MQLTKLEHACVRLEKDGVTLVIDPAAWSMPRALEGASAVLITHEHFDHFDADGLRAALSADRGLQLWTNASVASEFAGFSNQQVHVVDEGDTFTAAGFDVHLRAPARAPAPGHPGDREHRVPDRRLALPPGRLVHGAAGPGADPAAARQRAVAQDGRDDRLRARGGPAARVRHPRRPVRGRRPYGAGQLPADVREGGSLLRIAVGTTVEV